MPPATPDPAVGGEFAAALNELRDWAGQRSGLPVVHGFGAADTSGPDRPVVLLHPVALAPAALDATLPVTAAVVASAQITASVLVAVVGSAPETAAATAADLALDALAGGRTITAAGPDLWSALGRPPGAGFVVALPVRRVLTRQQASLVRFPLRVDTHDLHRLPPSTTAPS